MQLGTTDGEAQRTPLVCLRAEPPRRPQRVEKSSLDAQSISCDVSERDGTSPAPEVMTLFTKVPTVRVISEGCLQSTR